MTVKHKLRVSVVRSEQIQDFHRDNNVIHLTGDDSLDIKLIGEMILAGYQQVGQTVDVGRIGFVIHIESE